MKKNFGRIQVISAQNAPRCRPANTRSGSQAVREVPTVSEQEWLQEVRRIRSALTNCRERAELLLRYLAA